MTSEADRIERLLALLRGAESKPVPTTTLGRMRRTASMMARSAGAAAKSKLTGSTTVDDVTVERLILALGEMKGLAMKVGQILSYIDAPIPSNVRRQLAILQAQSQRTPFAEIERVLREDLGERADALLAGLEREPVSSASIGQVHRATLPDGTSAAVKVRHPGIEEALRADFRGAQVGKRLASLLVPGADVSDFIDEAEAALLEECDYRREATSQRRFYTLYQGDPDIVVPGVHGDWSTTRVLTTAWHEGRSFEAFLGCEQGARDRAGAAMFRFYVGTFYRCRFFNNDPHPGNLLFHHDGRVVFLDYGGVREYSPAIVRAMAELSVAVREGAATDIERALTSLGARFEGKHAARERAAGVELARAFFAPLLAPGTRPIEVGFATALQDLMRHKRALLRLQLPGELLFLVRIRFGAYSVLARLGAEVDWRSLEAEAAAEALAARW